MDKLNKKLYSLKQKIKKEEPISIMIIGLGSVGCYLLDYLISLSDPQLKIIVVGRNRDKMQMDVNIIRTASTIRRQCRSEIKIIGKCDLNDVESIAAVLHAEKPDFIVNSSRVYSGLKYGSISWSKLRAYGIWTPLSIRYAKNIMEAYAQVGCQAISINTSYSDAVIPWLKSAGKSYFDFGSGNLNHLIPRMKFYISEKFGIDEGQDILLNIQYQGKPLEFNKDELLKACSISMPTDQKRNMMNASSNFDIICSVLTALREGRQIKIHTPGVDGEIGGYPVIIDGTNATAFFDESVWTMDEMRNANRKSIYCDGVENIKNGCLIYTDELLEKVENVFRCTLPKVVPFADIDEAAEKIIREIIEKDN